MNVPSKMRKSWSDGKKGECIPGEMTDKSNGVEENCSGKFPIRYIRVVKIPAQIIDACILLSREPFWHI